MQSTNMADFKVFDNPMCKDPFRSGPILNDHCGDFVTQCSLFLTLINTIVQNNTNIVPARIKSGKKLAYSYDFVVIGGGAAGAAVAGRLSEVPGWRVLLLEAGPDEPDAAYIPSNFGTYFGTDIDWNYKTVNESDACLANNGVCTWPRGKNLGGTTVHHGMAYHRGNSKDFDKWVAMGNEDWSWEKVYPYYLKSEDNREIDRVGSKYHSTGGPLPVERFPWQPQFAWDILKAGDEMGYGITEDMVGEKIKGFTIAQTVSDRGVRVSSASSYIRPHRDRPNLDVVLNAVATKIVFRRKRAIAVQYIKDSILNSVMVKREVIVSGGAVNSPQILLLSGVGPKADLKKLGIPVVHDLPGVGENLHNHVSYGLNFTIKSSVIQDSVDPLPTREYLRNQTGPLSSTGLAQVTAILSSPHTEPDDPDLQMFFSGYLANCNSEDTKPELRNIQIIPVNLHARSRGKLSLASRNPLDYPRICSNDLADPKDVEVILSGIHIALSLMEAPVMKKRELTLVSKPMPQCSAYEFKSDDYWRCAIRYDTRTENHQAGSCKMGPPTDEMAVLDSRLRVYGVKGVRVADSSSMPLMVSGNPIGAITMLAERAADFIKQDNLPCDVRG